MVTALRLALISVVVGLLMAVPRVDAQPRTPSTSMLWMSDDNAEVPDARSRLTRSDDKICVNIHTRMLPKGAYTVWGFMFNHPEHCTAPAPVGGASCGGDADFENEAVQVSALWVAGGIVGPDRIGHFSTCLAENTFPGQAFDSIGLTNAPGAEIHLVVRRHCAAEYDRPARLGAQLTLFGGNCTADTGGEGRFEGTCDCRNLQFAIHPAP
jgi:hypothetical protein